MKTYTKPELEMVEFSVEPIADNQGNVYGDNDGDLVIPGVG